MCSFLERFYYTLFIIIHSSIRLCFFIHLNYFTITYESIQISNISLAEEENKFEFHYKEYRFLFSTALKLIELIYPLHFGKKEFAKQN